VSLDWAGTFDLLDLEISRSGDGRTVVGLAAVWDTPTEVNDQHGRYIETISRGAFDKVLRERGDRPFPVMYNHGFRVDGSASDAYSVPIGRSIVVRADSRGLYTESRYNEGPDADRVLEAIRNGAITSQSFRGRVFKSSETPRRAGDRLKTVIRTELGLTEYGPTPSAVYREAAIFAVRSQAAALATLLGARFDLDKLAELARTSTTPEEPETFATPNPGAGTDEPPIGHSSRLAIRRAQVRARAILLGVGHATQDGGGSRR
jgi:HK97 family phage prohead protease